MNDASRKKSSWTVENDMTAAISQHNPNILTLVAATPDE